MSLQRVEIITEGAILLFFTKAVTYNNGPKMKRGTWVKAVLEKKLLSLRCLSSFSPVFIRYGFNILRFKFLNLKSSIVPSVWQKLSCGMSRPTTSKKWENPNIFIFLLLFTSIHFLQKHLISLHSFFLLLFLLPIPSLICYMKDHPWNFGPQVSRAWMWWVWTLHWKVSVTQKVQ